jgi:hypothetical protein
VKSAHWVDGKCIESVSLFHSWRNKASVESCVSRLPARPGNPSKSAVLSGPVKTRSGKIVSRRSTSPWQQQKAPKPAARIRLAAIDQDEARRYLRGVRDLAAEVRNSVAPE